MNCPRCDAGSRVVDSRDDLSSLRRRTRRCANGHRFVTYEVPAERLRELRALAAVAKEKTNA